MNPEVKGAAPAFQREQQGGACYRSCSTARLAATMSCRVRAELAAWEINGLHYGQYTGRMSCWRSYKRQNIDFGFRSDHGDCHVCHRGQQDPMGLNLECSLGLQTTQLDDRILSWYFSPQLHAVCSMESRRTGLVTFKYHSSLRQAAVRDRGLVLPS
jgi:hypothetical protein